MDQSVPYVYIYILYRTFTCYNRLPEDESSDSKHVRVEGTVKIKIKIK